MNVLVVSLNFNAGHFSHLMANYFLLSDSGFTPSLYVHPSFNLIDEKDQFRKINSASELRKFKTVDAAIFWFPSLKNIIEIIRFRLLYKAQIIYVLHEPFDSIKKYYKAGFRFKKIVKICLINLVNIPVILLSNKIVLPSALSYEVYKRKFSLLNSNYSYLPLLFTDEAKERLAECNKKYISYIGTVAADHAFDKFVDFVHGCLINDWFPDITFLIATSSKIPEREKRLLQPYYESGQVIIVEGNYMTNEKINGFYGDSLVIWNAYNRSMQSGVLPKAYMFGTPVVVLSRNANEFIENHKTGILIEENDNIFEIRDAVREIIDKKDFFFKHCRDKFLDTFYYKSNLEKFHLLITKK